MSLSVEANAFGHSPLRILDNQQHTTNKSKPSVCLTLTPPRNECSLTSFRQEKHTVMVEPSAENPNGVSRNSCSFLKVR